MLRSRRPWQEELEIIDRTMRAISSVSDPNELVDVYWRNIGELIPINDYVAVSRRDVQPPDYLITRSSRFTEEFNPWTQRHLLPHLRGGLLGEIAFAEKPVIIDDLPARLADDDPARFYLEGHQSLLALPHYDQGVALNVSIMLLPKGAEIDPSIIPVLHWQSGLFGRGTQNLVLRNQLAEALAQLDRELQAVADIQRSLLPASLPDIPGFELASHYTTSARAGGDYYDFFPLADGSWGIFIADVSGHGTPAAVLMAITHAIAHAKPHGQTPPGALLNYLNHRLATTYTHNGTFITAFYGVLNPASRTLRYAAAGHNPPRLKRNTQILSLDRAGDLPLGILREQHYSEAELILQPGDDLVLYTDGITEAMAPAPPGESPALFGVERLDAALADHPPHASGKASDIVQRILAHVERFAQGRPPADDRTVVVLRCLP